MEKAKDKAFFFDFDGTLWFGEYGERTVEALNILHAKGGKLFYNSGRSKGNTRKDRLKDIPFDGYLYGGGHLEIGGKEIFRQDIEKEQLKKVIEIELKYGLTILYEGVNEVYKQKGILSHCNGEEMEDIFEITQSDEYPITKFSIIKEQTKGNIVPVPDEVMEYLQERFIVVDFYHYVEVMNKGLGKDFLINKVVNELSLNIEDTYAFGDSNNDAPALRVCRHGVAMRSSPDELKSLAEYVTKDDKNGVVEALEHFGFIKKSDYKK